MQAVHFLESDESQLDGFALRHVPLAELQHLRDLGLVGRLHVLKADAAIVRDELYRLGRFRGVRRLDDERPHAYSLVKLLRC